MTYTYYIIANYNDAEVTVATNDIEVAILSLMEHSDATLVTVSNGFTGEVLASVSVDSAPYFEDAFSLACFGYLVKSMYQGGER